jgi:hypothetical protein
MDRPRRSPPAPFLALLLSLLPPLARVRAGPPQYNVECSPAGYVVPGAPSTCTMCGISSLRAGAAAQASIMNGSEATTSCFESFELHGIPDGAFLYAPPAWNAWRFAASAGISSATGPWAPAPAAAAAGAHFAFIQAPVVNATVALAISRPLYNLLPGTPATVAPRSISEYTCARPSWPH